jgi:hypothetical protein
MKIRAQIGMVLNLDKCIGYAQVALLPQPFLPRASLERKGAIQTMHLPQGDIQ